MRHSIILTVIAGLGISSALLTPAQAQTSSEVLAGQVDTLVTAIACQKEFGADWDDIVSTGYEGVNQAILELDEPMAKPDIDVLLMEAQAEGEAMEMTDDLRAECNRIISFGS